MKVRVRRDAAARRPRYQVDSLVAVELRAQIERDLAVVVPVVRLLDGPSVTELAGWLSPAAVEPAPSRGKNAPAVNGINDTDPRLGVASWLFVTLTTDTVPFSSSVPNGLQHAWQRGLVGSGDVGEIVSVGSGFQIGCTTYRF